MQVLLSITLTNGALATGLVMRMCGFPLLLLHLLAGVPGLGLAYRSSLLFARVAWRYFWTLSGQ